VFQNIKNGFDQRYEAGGIRKDGTKYPLAIRGKNIPYKGRIVRVKEFRDITESKVAEKCTQRERDFSQAALDSLPGLFYMFNEQGHFLRWNENFEKISGYASDEISQLTPLALFDGPDLETVTNAIKHCFVVGEVVVEAVFISKNQTKTPCLFTGKLFYFDQQPCLIGMGIDISERQRAEHEKLVLEQQFHHAQKLESLGVLAGGIAHDFNNILTVIMGHCYMARENFITEQEYKSMFKQIETAGNRATDLCRQMLTYAGKSLLVQTRVNLWLLVDEVVKMLQSAIKKNVTIELDLKREVPEIRGDTGQIQQIIMNLIINAAEAIGDNNGTIKVVLSKADFEAGQTVTDTFGTVIRAGKYTCLEVTDTGCGMNEETQKKIFEPFYTTKFTGRGLGMSAIRGIIKSHEGILSLTSKKSVGTTFKVYFPVPEASDYLETDSIESAPSIDAGGTILLVEDEEALRVMGKALLEAMGFSAMTAQNGREALELYHEQRGGIDVILLDLIMPVMGGIEAYKELRKVDAAIPIIICSGYGVESVEHVIKNDEHAGFVHKPYKPDELRNVIMKMMRYEVGS
jgi:PAS domain S-box-containing protein